jgi:hypothetical protein
MVSVESYFIPTRISNGFLDYDKNLTMHLRAVRMD